MPSPAAGVSHGQSRSMTSETSSASSSRGASSIFPQGDPSVHMLGLPKSHPKLKRWVLLAVIVGAAAAIVLLGIFS
jgi:hypothetical protein